MSTVSACVDTAGRPAVTGVELERAAEHPPEDFRATCQDPFHDVERWEKIFDDPERVAWQRPTQLVQALGIEPGTTVVDLGAGTGFLLPYLSAAVGSDGRVIAVEVEPTLVEHLRTRAGREGLINVEARLSPHDRLQLDRASADLLLLLDTYHHIDGRLEYFRKAADVLAPGGRVAIIDWKPGNIPVGPHREEHKLPFDQVIREMRQAGYRLLDAPDLLPHQYVLVFGLTVQPRTE